MISYSTLTDTQLVELLYQGDKNAYAEIFERYARLLIAHAYRMLGDEEESKDVVHDVMLVIWQNRETLQNISSLSAYLFKSIRNRILNQLSRQQVKDKYITSFATFKKEHLQQADDRLLEKETALLIQQEINALPGRMKEIFLLSREEGLGYKEIARRLNITEQTARQQVYNAMKILKHKISTLINLLFLL